MFHSLFSGNTASIYICSLVRIIICTYVFVQWQQAVPAVWPHACSLPSCVLFFIFCTFARALRKYLPSNVNHPKQSSNYRANKTNAIGREERSVRRVQTGHNEPNSESERGEKVLIYPFVCTMIREILWYCQKNVENSLAPPTLSLSLSSSILSFFEPTNVSVLND